MKLSIIIPVYNNEKTIYRCLDSIFNQTYKGLEIIIVNDGSEDNSLSIIEYYFNEHIIEHTIINIKHSGSSIARQKGIESSYGEYLGFIDGDDHIYPDYYETMMKLIDDNDIICSDILLNNKLIQNNRIGVESGYEAKIELLNQRSVYQYLCNKVIQKSLFDDITFPQDDMIGEDFIVMMKLLDKARSVKCINDVYYIYQRNKYSQSRLGFCDKHLNLYKHLNKLYEDSKNEDSEFINSLNRYMVTHYMAILVSMIRNNNYDEDLIIKLVNFIKNNKDNYLSYSNDPFIIKAAVFILCINYNLFKNICSVLIKI